MSVFVKTSLFYLVFSLEAAVEINMFDCLKTKSNKSQCHFLHTLFALCYAAILFICRLAQSTEYQMCPG